MLLKLLTSLALAFILSLSCCLDLVYSQTELIASPTLGLKIQANTSGELVVQEVMPGSSAAKAGVSKGEKITAINGINLAGRSASTVSMKLRGAIGSYIDITFDSSTKGVYTEQLKFSRAVANSKPSQLKTTKYNTSTDFKTKPSFKQKPPVSKTVPKTTAPAHRTEKTTYLNYKSPGNNFSMKVPDGWEVKSDAKTGKIEVYSFDDESLSIFPFFLSATSLNEMRALGLFKGLLKTYAPGIHVANPTIFGNSVKLTSKKDGIKTAYVLVYNNMGNNTVGRFIIAQAPTGYSEHYSKVFTTVLNSLRLHPQRASVNTSSGQAPYQTMQSNPGQNLAWTIFTDPKQGAFSVEVPQGWTTNGALEQPMAVDTRGWVRTISPDKKAIVFIGDPKVPSFTLPTMQLTSLGFPPGSRYSPGYGFSTIVAYYMPANKYVPQYGRKILKKLNMSNINLLGMNNHPRLAHMWNKNKGINLAYSASSCKFTCMSGGTPMVAYFLGSTRKDTHLWYMTVMTGILCSADRENLATRVFLHMFKTFKMNPNWQQGQLNLTAKFSRRMFQNWREINQIMRDSYNYRSAIQDRTHRKVVNALRGTQDVVDPGTGTVYNVESGSNYHWLNADGQTVLGTNQVMYPGANWTRLTNVP